MKRIKHISKPKTITQNATKKANESKASMENQQTHKPNNI